MIRNLSILCIAVVVIVLPFLFRQENEASGWQVGDPELVIVSPHNEAIRYEFAYAFSEWHRATHGRPVRVDWRTVGGTTEIMRYLQAQYVAAFRAHWTAEKNLWPQGGGEMISDRYFKPRSIPPEVQADPDGLKRWHLKAKMHQAFRDIDDSTAFGSKIDLFFGGGVYDHGKAYALGLTVAPWTTNAAPAGLFKAADGTVLVPETIGGETWRSPTFFGNAVSTFGICYNFDRLKDLGIPDAPARWRDLTDSRYFGQIGVADPTKSGSIAKAFEVIVHEQCHRSVRKAGFTVGQVSGFEQRIRSANTRGSKMPAGVPREYQEAIEEGWRAGLHLVQCICANARYFTDSASKVPIDVSTGNAAAGLAIDFYARYQAEVSRNPDNGEARMAYVTPRGGSGVSADPISLLRGAEHRELAIRFITFVMSEAGQRLWTYAPGTPGGPQRYALRRLPIRRDFYPGGSPSVRKAHAEHARYAVDPLSDPAVNPYVLAGEFTYHSRWTGRHFSVQRDLIRAMCMDAGVELREAWHMILENGGPDQQPKAMALMRRLPDQPELLTWESAMGIGKRFERIDIMREWTTFFRKSYGEAMQAVEQNR